MNKSELKALIQKALTQPSKSFGHLVLEVNHRVIGDEMRKFRISKRVYAAKVARAMNTTRGNLAHLEKGINRWSLDLMERYVRIIEQTAKEQRRITEE